MDGPPENSLMRHGEMAYVRPFFAIFEDFRVGEIAKGVDGPPLRCQAYLYVNGGYEASFLRTLDVSNEFEMPEFVNKLVTVDKKFILCC